MDASSFVSDVGSWIAKGIVHRDRVLFDISERSPNERPVS